MEVERVEEEMCTLNDFLDAFRAAASDLESPSESQAPPPAPICPPTAASETSDAHAVPPPGSTNATNAVVGFVVCDLDATCTERNNREPTR